MQVDGSTHDCFEENKCSLLGFIDKKKIWETQEILWPGFIVKYR